MKILCFGVAKDVIGNQFLEIESGTLKTVGELKTYIIEKYPAFRLYQSFMVAVNQNYAEDSTPIGTHDEIAIIPPVSGG